MWARAAADADAAVRQNPQDAFAWFNLGTGLTALGRFDEAGDAYDQARRIGLPWRMLWYQFGPFRAYYETGRYDEVIALADATLRTAKARRGAPLLARPRAGGEGRFARSQASLKRALELNPNYAEASAALASVRPMSSAAVRQRHIAAQRAPGRGCVHPRRRGGTAAQHDHRADVRHRCRAGCLLRRVQAPRPVVQRDRGRCAGDGVHPGLRRLPGRGRSGRRLASGQCDRQLGRADHRPRWRRSPRFARAVAGPHASSRPASVPRSRRRRSW